MFWALRIQLQDILPHLRMLLSLVSNLYANNSFRIVRQAGNTPWLGNHLSMMPSIYWLDQLQWS